MNKIMKDISRMKNIFENIDNDLTLKNRRCCFTGHRFISNEHMDKIEKNLPIVIRTLAERGITEFLSGGALGFDMIAAKAVIREREKNGDIRLVLALPCMNHNRGWKNADKANFESVAAMSDETIYVSDDYYDGCMLRRNRYMVDKSRHCIFYMAYPRGGTAYTVRYALDSNLEMHNIMIPEQPLGYL